MSVPEIAYEIGAGFPDKDIEDIHPSRKQGYSKVPRELPKTIEAHWNRLWSDKISI